MNETLFIDPKENLLSGVLSLLTQPPFLRHSPTGTASLAHCLIVLPTAGSGRQLRQALAHHFGARGLLSPKIVQPAHLIQTQALPYPIATATEHFAALIQFFRSYTNEDLHTRWPHLFYTTSIETISILGFAKQLNELWETLASNGLTFRAIAESPKTQAFFKTTLTEEILRWKELADLEVAFLDFLHIHKRCSKSEAFVLAQTQPLPLDAKIDTILLPALVDPLPILYPILETYQQQYPNLKIVVVLHATPEEREAFDIWGRPTLEAWTDTTRIATLRLQDYLSSNALSLYAQDEDLAEAVAQAFQTSTSSTLPRLSILNEKLFHPIKLALKRSLPTVEIHNPSLYPLAQSPLGRLTQNLLSILRASPCFPWNEFMAFIRSEDVLTFLKTHHNIARESLLVDLNNYQNAYLPQTIQHTFNETKFPYLSAAMKALVSTIEPTKAQTIVKQIRDIFRKFFEGRLILQDESTKEFCNAIASLTNLLKEFDTPLVQQLTEEDQEQLFLMLLKSSTYPLEAETSTAQNTVGWLELAWIQEKEIYLTGFNEGCIPDAIVGHAFLPDSLRAHLGLTHNEQRLARDTFLFAELLRSRPRDALRISVSLATAQGDMLKPSRLLFLCDDATLVKRVQALFGEVSSLRPMVQRQLPKGWQLDLRPPTTPLPKTINATQLDAYLQCPFTYYLKYRLKMESKNTIQEFQASTFGTKIHNILYRFAQSKNKNASTQEAIFEALQGYLDEEAEDLRHHATCNADLFISSMVAVLKNFAKKQAEIRNEGWEIMAVEIPLRLPNNMPLFEDLPFSPSGIVDRIDYHPQQKIYRIIDYKTWENKKRKDDLLFVRQAARLEYMKACGYPVFEFTEGKRNTTKDAVMLSTQLSFYKMILELRYPDIYTAHSSSSTFTHQPRGEIKELAYFILNRTEATLDTTCSDCVRQHETMVAYMKHAMHRLAKGIFWPPAPPNKGRAAWSYDFAHLFLSSPEEDLKDSAILALLGGEV